MLTGPSPAPSASGATASSALQRFLAAGERQRRRDWGRLRAVGAELQPSIWSAIGAAGPDPADWAWGSLLQLLAEDPQQRLLLDQRWPSGCLTVQSSEADLAVALQQALVLQQWEEADRVTSALLRRLAGPGAERRGYVYFSEVAPIAPADLDAIDHLWWFYSQGRYGFRVQRRLWQQCEQRWERLWPLLGWKAEGIWTRYPTAFTWSLEAPEGHLPLVNQLRGVRVMDALLRHPGIDGPALSR
ncbi:MAG: GUN4 domain-containing protein [Cyanobacteriota bacterium]